MSFGFVVSLPQTDVLNVPGVDDSGLLMFWPVGGSGVAGLSLSHALSYEKFV